MGFKKIKFLYMTIIASSLLGLSSCARTSLTSVSSSIFSGPVPPGAAFLSWDPNSEPNISGYRVYYGTASGVYNQTADMGNVTQYLMSGLATGRTYFFTITAYDTSGNESLHSNEVSKAIQ